MNTNEQTIHQMGLEISSLVKQATGRESVSSIDMDWVSVEQMARYIYGSDSGDVVSFDTNIPDAIESLIAYITAVQDTSGGDPSPSNVCPITGWTGCTVTDANMLDSSDPDYDAETYDFTFPDEAGTVYGGTLDVLSGVLTVTHAKVKVSDLSWTKYGEPVAVYYAKVSDKINNADNVLMSDTFKASENTAQNTTQAQNLLSDNMCIASKGTANPYIYCRADSIDSAATFSSTYADAYFIYELAEPVTYQLTAQEVTALIGANNIFADTGNVSVQYKVKEDLV